MAAFLRVGYNRVYMKVNHNICLLSFLGGMLICLPAYFTPFREMEGVALKYHLVMIEANVLALVLALIISVFVILSICYYRQNINMIKLCL
jgi:hypothetical protein